LDLPGFALTDAEFVTVILSQDVGANATLNVNNTGAIGLYMADGSPIAAGTAKAESALICVYNATENRYRVIGTGGGGAASYMSDTEPVGQANGGIWYDTAGFAPIEGEPGFRENVAVASDAEPIGQAMGAMWYDTSAFEPIEDGSAVSVENATASPDEPASGDLWFDTDGA
jgi:hypothetical protein